MSLPTGTVTFLFTDIEGSTERWERDRASMQAALARHNAILDRAIEAHGGATFKTMGDAYCAAFPEATAALEAAIDAQRALHHAVWSEVAEDFEPLLVRMGIHTGQVELKDGDYHGRPVNRVARLMSAGHGGQVLVSLATQQLVRDALTEGATLIDAGEHRLKDLEHEEHIYRLLAPGMPEIDTPPDTAGAIAAPARPVLDGADPDAPCPYRGLHAFREEDAAFFFGREIFTDLLVESLASAPMLGVVGPSGSGKSSVVHAGLVPRLRAGAIGGGSNEWTIASLRPGNRPFHALAATLVPLLEPDASQTDLLVETAKLADALAEGQVGLHDVLSRLSDARPELGRLFLVADQFEELYTLCPDESVQRGFQDLLFEGAFGGNGSGPALWLALTLRADFMGHALAYRPFADAMQKHDVKLGPMNREELSRVIAKPAELQGRAFEPGLVDRIADDVGEKTGALPLLEFALTKLWEEQEAGWLTHEAYERIGRVEGAVARHADAVYEGLGEAEREGTRRVFVQLVQPGEGTEDTRRLASRAELEEQWPLVQRLADERLVTTGRDSDGYETAEVIHEALIRSWGRLVGWMKEDRRFRMWQERLRFAIRQWEEAGRDEGALLRGVPLSEAEEWGSVRAGALVEAELAYVDRSIEQREKRHAEARAQQERERALEKRSRNRLRALVWALAGGLLIAVALAGLAAQQTRSSQRSEARARSLALASAAQVALEDGEPARALALALEAAPDEDVPLEARLALGQAAYSPGPRFAIPDEGFSQLVLDGRRDLLFVATGTSLDLYSSLDGSATRSITTTQGDIFYVLVHPEKDLVGFTTDDPLGVGALDSATGSVQWQRPMHVSGQGALDPVNDIIYTPSRRRMIGLSLHDGSDRGVFETHGSSLRCAAVSPEHGLLAGGTGDGSVVVWDTRSGKLIRRIEAHRGPINHIAFSPDGTALASSGLAGDAGPRVWAVDSGRPMHELDRHPNTVMALKFDGRGRLMSADRSGLVLVTDLATGTDSQRFQTAPVEQADIALSGSQLVMLQSPGVGDTAYTEVQLWDLEQGSTIWRSAGDDGRIMALAVSPDGSEVAAGTRDGTVRIMDSSNGELLRRIDARPDRADKDGKYIIALDYAARGDRILTGSYDGMVRLWDVASRKMLHSWDDLGDFVWGVGFSNEGRVALASAWSGSIHGHDSETGERLYRVGLEVALNDLAVLPDDSLVVGTQDGRVLRVNVSDGARETVMSGWEGIVGSIDVGPDGATLAAVDANGQLIAWDAESSDEVGRYLRQGKAEIRFDPDGNIIYHAIEGSPTIVAWSPLRNEVVDAIHAPGDVKSIATHEGIPGIVAGLEDGSVVLLREVQSVASLRSWARENRHLTPLSCADRDRYSLPGCEGELDSPALPTSAVSSPPTFSSETARSAAPGAEPPDVDAASAPTHTAVPTSVAIGRGLIATEPVRGEILVGAADAWTLGATGGEAVDIEMKADRASNAIVDLEAQAARSLLDARLVVRSPSGEVVAEEDDIAGALRSDARIESLVLAEPGSYTVEARSAGDATGGTYELAVRPIRLEAEPYVETAVTDTVRSASFTSDGQRLLLGTASGQVLELDSEGQALDRCQLDAEEDAEVLGLGRTGNDNRMLAALQSSDGLNYTKTLVAWDRSRCAIVNRSAPITETTWGLSLSSGPGAGRALFGTRFHPVLLAWDDLSTSRAIDAHMEVGRLIPGSDRIASLSADGSRGWVVPRVQLHAETGEEIARLEAPADRRWMTIAVDSTGQYVAAVLGLTLASATDREIRILASTDLQEVQRISGLTESPRHMEFIPGTDRLLSLASDGVLREWSVPSGEETRRFGDGKGGDAEAGLSSSPLAVSPDGTMAMTLFADGTLRLWRLADQDAEEMP